MSHIQTQLNDADSANCPLLVMAIEDGWFGDDRHQCVFAAIRLLPSLVKSLQAISQVSHDIGGAELLLGHWPVLWDQSRDLEIDRTVWRVVGNRHFAEAFNSDGKLLGRTVNLDVRELTMIEGEIAWHETDESAMAVEDMLFRPFIDLAAERLTAMGLMEIGEAPTESKAAVRSLLLELED